MISYERQLKLKYKSYPAKNQIGFNFTLPNSKKNNGIYFGLNNNYIDIKKLATLYTGSAKQRTNDF
jgi:hypothetical protein